MRCFFARFIELLNDLLINLTHLCMMTTHFSSIFDELEKRLPQTPKKCKYKQANKQKRTRKKSNTFGMCTRSTMVMTFDDCYFPRECVFVEI